MGEDVNPLILRADQPIDSVRPMNSIPDTEVLITSNTVTLRDEAEEDKGRARAMDITLEVFITELEPRFTGNFSDVYIGQFRDKRVRLQSA